jgi:nicotinate-nucleotide adenylyltransferase
MGQCVQGKKSRQSSVVSRQHGILATHDARLTTHRKIGLLGGSFNPAHAGHLHISLEALKRLKLDEIWWLVSPKNPLKKADDLADYALRLSFARGLTNHPRIRVLDVEQRHGLYYTIDSIRFLQAHHRDCAFVWLMGADNLAGFHRWRNWREIARRLPIAILDRAPYGIKALHARFALTHARYRLSAASAARLANAAAPQWVYLAIPRHPLSATFLRKTLGKNAFLRHTARK